MKAGKYASQRVFVVFRYIKSAYALFQAGIEMPQLNLGNVTQNKGETITLDKTVRVSPEEEKMLKEMAAAGVKITASFRFSDPETDLGTHLN